jgi:uncharacterized membrane protein (UPF0127 family)
MNTTSYTRRYNFRAICPTKSTTGALKRLTYCLVQSAAALVFVLASLSLQADPLLTYPLRIGEHAIRAELANTPQTRRNGLMFRQYLATSSAMIFVFPNPQRVSMWMKNTLIPLSVAFIDADGRILNIEDMQPHSEQSHASVDVAMYALEMNQGWFAERGIRAGDLVSGLEHLPAAN